MSQSFAPKPTFITPDYSNSLTHGQVGWWACPGSGLGVVNSMEPYGSALPSVKSGVSDGAGPFGTMFTLDGTANSYIDLGSTKRFLSSTSPFTFAWMVIQGSSPPSYEGVAVFFGSGASNPFLIMRSNDTVTPAYDVLSVGKRTNFAVPRFTTAPSLASSVGVLQMWVLVNTAGGMDSTTAGNFTLLVADYDANTVTGYATTTLNSGGFSTNTTAANILGWDNVDSTSVGKYDNYRLWNRALSDPELFQLCADPFSGGRPIDWTFAGAGTLKTVDGLAKASVKTINNLAMSSGVKSFVGLTT